MKFEHLLAHRISLIENNVIKDILKVAAQPGMISLAGGVPAPECFPLDIFEQLTVRVIERYGVTALQYSNTTGFDPFKHVLIEYLKLQGIEAKTNTLIVGSGSQGLLDGIGKIFLQKGDKIIVEAPTYLGAMHAFDPYEPTYVEVDTDDKGIIPESLEELLCIHVVKFIYSIPTFQNPTGYTLTLDRRRKIGDLIQRYNVVLVEDDPYSALRYRGECLPSIKQIAPNHVVYISTFSKIFAPGLRIGFAVAPDLICHWLEIVKQGVDLHTSTFNQALAAEYIEYGYLDQQLPYTIDVYRTKQQAMLNALEKYFPRELNWSKPDGGMFLWVECLSGINIDSVYRQALKQNVAFVPGKFFFTGERNNTQLFRLNYSANSVQNITRAIKILSEILILEIEKTKK